MSDSIPRLGSQVEAAFALWRASLRPALPFALLYTVAGLLPALTLGDVHLAAMSVVNVTGQLLANPVGTVDLPDAGALVEALQAWLLSPVTWLVIALSALLVACGITGLLIRQDDVLHGRERSLGSSLAVTLARLPAALVAWLTYFALMLLATLPIGLLAVGLIAFADSLGMAGLLTVLMLFLLASLVLSIPLAWASVAFGFAPLAASVGECGPLAAQALSARRVRGHWVRSATVVTLPLLVYLGAGSAVSSLALVLAAGGAYLIGGTAAVFGGAWFGWMQVLLVLPMAGLLPLAFAGMTVGWQDLKRIQRSA